MRTYPAVSEQALSEHALSTRLSDRRAMSRTRALRLCRRTRSGQNLVELLIGMLLALLTGAALFSLMQSNYASRSVVTGQNFANANTRQPLDVLSDTLRNAQSSMTQAALVDAGPSDVTCSTSPDGSTTTRIWLDTSVTPHELKRSKNNGAAQTLVVGLQSLQITYFTPAGGAYNAATSSWTPSSDPNSQLGGIGAAYIKAVFNNNGNMATLESFVRLRNSPYTHP